VRRPPSVNLGPPNISETTRARKLKFKFKNLTRYCEILDFGIIIFQLGAYSWRRAPNVILGPHNISETTRATRVKYKCIFR